MTNESNAVERRGARRGFSSPKIVRAPSFSMTIGDKLRDQTPSGLWPTDHAGVIARMRLRSAR